MTKQIEFEIVHNYKNCLDIDTTEEEDLNYGETFESISS